MMKFCERRARPEAISLTPSMFLKGRLLVRRQFAEALQPMPLLGTAEDGVAASAIAGILHELATFYPGAPFAVVAVVVGGVSPAAAVVPPLATVHTCGIFHC
jgi:hypothetical protein